MKSPQRRHTLLFLCWLTYIAAYLCRLSYASALPKMVDGLSTPAEYLGIAASVYFIVYAVSQLINGFLGDRLNPYGFIILATVMTSVVNLLIAASSSYMSVAIIWALNGFCQSIFWGVFLRLLSLSFVSENRKLVSTVMSTSSNIGILVSWTGLGLLFEHRSWQIYFFVPGVIMALLIPLWILMMKRFPVGRLVDRHKHTTVRQSIRELSGMRIQYVCLLSCCTGFIKEGLAAWAPTIFSQTLNLKRESSLILLMIVPVANILGIFTGRRMLVKCKDDCKKTMITLLGAVAVCVISMIVTQNELSFLTVLLIGLLCTLLNAASWIIISFLPLTLAGRNMVSTTAGIFDFSIYVGASVASVLMGFLMARFGWTAIPVMWIIVTGLAMVLSWGKAGVFLKAGGKQRECVGTD